MKRKLIVTSDGSHTFYLPDWDEHYHSKFGAIEESSHLFIQNGLNCIEKNHIDILEIGFGTGLNAFLTYKESLKRNFSVYYDTLEKYPLNENEINLLNYTKNENDHLKSCFKKLHTAKWDKEIIMESHFTFIKRKIDLLGFIPSKNYDVIFFDAFAPDLQPELWSEKVFSLLYECLKKDGLLVTYSIKGKVKRAMQSSGFAIEKIKGPEGGKKENLRAWKRNN